jgi:hypothetical protein
MKIKKIYLILIAIVVAAGIIGWGVFQALSAQSSAQLWGESWKNATDRVVLKVNDQEATEKDLVSFYLTLRYNPALSSKGDQELKVEALARLIEDKVLLSEALKRGYGVSEEEARAYSEEIRKSMNFPDVIGKEWFEDLIKGMGVSQQEYWKMAPKGYQMILSVSNLMANLRKNIPPPTAEEIQAWKKEHPNYQNAPLEVLQQEVAQDNFERFRQDFVKGLLKEAEINALEPQLQELLPQALKLIEQGLGPIPIPTLSP